MIKSKLAKIIDGKTISKKFLQNLKQQINDVKIQPALAIIQVGCREDSNIYIRNKIKSANQVGISVRHLKFDSTAYDQGQIENEIQKLNEDSQIHGIIVQLPLETNQKLDTNSIINKVSHFKDVDGLTDINAGKLSNGTLANDIFIPCTPKACFELIKSTGIEISGKQAVVIGRSRLIGTPMSNLLKWHDATVTTCHSKTKNLKEVCSNADILVAAVGKARLVRKDWVKNGAVVIDCGINEMDGKLCGDVDFDEVQKKAAFITPVPGGVGPMTVAHLLGNTFESALRFSNKKAF